MRKNNPPKIADAVESVRDYLLTWLPVVPRDEPEDVLVANFVLGMWRTWRSIEAERGDGSRFLIHVNFEDRAIHDAALRFVGEALRDNRPIPDYVREYVAGVLLGERKPKPRRGGRSTTWGRDARLSFAIDTLKRDKRFPEVTLNKQGWAWSAFEIVAAGASLAWEQEITPQIVKNAWERDRNPARPQKRK